MTETSSRTIEPQDVTLAKSFKGKSGATLPYRLYLPPDYNANRSYPLVLFFHGAGERGNDNIKQLTHGVKELLQYSRAHQQPFILVAPQCPEEQQWVDTPWSDPAHTMPETPSNAMQLAIEILQDIRDHYSIAPDRLYVTGLSMGGFGAWDIIQRHPDWFAAALLVCGGGDTAEADKLIKLPLWVTHGDEDTAVLTQRSRDMVAAIRAAGGNPNYTEFKDTGHNAWSPTYGDDNIIKWLLSQVKK